MLDKYYFWHNGFQNHLDFHPFLKASKLVSPNYYGKIIYWKLIDVSEKEIKRLRGIKFSRESKQI